MKNILTFIPYTSPWIIRQHLHNARTILDVGCGDGALMAKVNLDKKYNVTGVDLYQPYLKKADKRNVYKKLLVSDLRNLKFNNKSFDVVLASQVIEHLSKRDALKLIKKLENIARSKVIITTPNGYVKYDPFEVKDDNKLQRHKSGWGINEMRGLGYEVYGQGSKYIYRSGGLLYRFRNLKYFFVVISYLMSPITYFLPNMSSCLVTVKKI